VSVKLAWVGIAEGWTADARGMLTLVGFAPMSFEVKTVPSVINLALVAVVEDDRQPKQILSAGLSTTISPEVRGPDGSIVLAGSMAVALPDFATSTDDDPAAPVRRVNAVVGAMINAAQEGWYSVTLRYQVKDDVLEGTTTFRVKIAEHA
jgi:hypothetical protein